jgi:N-methylhydantoinase A
VGSALGFFTAPRAFDVVRSHKQALETIDLVVVERIFAQLEREGAEALQAGSDGEPVCYARSVDMRFVGQGSETNLSLSESELAGLSRQRLRARFDGEYARLYGRTYPESPVELVNFRVRASLPERLLELPRLAARAEGGDPKGVRRAYSALAGEFIEFTVHDRYRLAAGQRLAGPAIIEERESTVVLDSDASASVDEYGFLWIDMTPSGGAA